MKLFLLLVLLGVTLSVSAQEATQENLPANAEVVEMSGISIIGNLELPKSLFIVPWKTSEVGIATEINNSLDENMRPIDREVFMRELDYYNLSHTND